MDIYYEVLTFCNCTSVLIGSDNGVTLWALSVLLYSEQKTTRRKQNVFPFSEKGLGSNYWVRPDRKFTE
jgi:hypothetical protein